MENIVKVYFASGILSLPGISHSIIFKLLPFKNLNLLLEIAEKEFVSTKTMIMWTNL
jgi:hypothetical protein